MQEVLGKEVEGLRGLETFKGLPTVPLKTKLKPNLCDTQRTQSLLAMLGYWLSGGSYYSQWCSGKQRHSTVRRTLLLS